MIMLQEYPAAYPNVNIVNLVQTLPALCLPGFVNVFENQPYLVCRLDVF